MSNLDSEVAIAISAFHQSVMADVIDSLKRLERVGSETSKTTEKLIEAAANLAQSIVRLCSTQPAEGPIQLVNRPGRVRGLPDSKPPYAMSYSIRDGHLVNDYDGEPVSSSRLSAIRFSEDIAEGLLDAICAGLEHRRTVDVTALNQIAFALNSRRPLYEPIKIEILRVASYRTGSSVPFRVLDIATKAGVDQDDVEEVLVELHAQGYLRLSCWDGSRERPFDEWPSARAFFAGLEDGGYRRARLLLRGKEYVLAFVPKA